MVSAVTSVADLPEEFLDVENLLSPAVAATLIPGRPSVHAVWRWITSGTRKPGGGTIKLRSIKVAGKRLIHRNAIAEFIRAFNQHEDTPEPVPVAPSDIDTGRAALAGAKLAALGVR